MRTFLYSIFFLLLATSCQLFETEKIPSETFYEQEVKSINWNDIDQYPIFKSCETLSEKSEQKNCFETALAERIQFKNTPLLLADTERVDTLLLEVWVSKDGVLGIKNIKMDSMVQKQYPELLQWIETSIDSLQVVAPAYKRGIPVATQFKLPVVLKTQ